MSQVSDIIVNWTPETSGRVYAAQIQSRIVGTQQWTEQAGYADPTLGTFRFGSNAPSSDVEVRMRYRMVDGVSSAWTLMSIHTAPVTIPYIDLAGAPTKLGDINAVEGGKLGGISPGATEYSVYSGVDNDYIKTLAVSGGKAVFSGALQAGTSIRLGSGAGWPVALASQDISVTDGQSISFGTNLGNIPKLTFAGNNLAALNAGETYSLVAENLTPTGFTARLRIITPVAPANYDLTVSTAPGTGPTRQISKGSNPDSTNGNYRLAFGGTYTMGPTSFEDGSGFQ